MRILFLHPSDRPISGPWSAQNWNQVVDLGAASPRAYNEWSAYFRCSVSDLGFQRTASSPIRDALHIGSQFLCDKHGIDWWEIISTEFLQHMYRIAALQTVAESVRLDDELFFSRSCFDSRALEIILNRPVSAFSLETGLFRRLKRRFERARKLSYSQIRQIAFDKYDPEHRVRSSLLRARAQSKQSVVLLPSAYVNVTRSALAYAAALPGARFLLVAARRSGWSATAEQNVLQVDLAAYGKTQFNHDEYNELCSRWDMLQKDLSRNGLLRILLRVGVLDHFPRLLRRWLVIRNAWINVFEAEPITAVFSCDDNNPYTAIPLILAKHRGFPSICCHHGALDGHRMIRQSFADVLLAKGNMERDYLVNICKISPSQVKVGAPLKLQPSTLTQGKPWVIFFSEDYEVSGARVDEYYRDVLPSLLRIAIKHGKDLVIKLHPAESSRDRKRILQTVLSPKEFHHIRIVEGPLTDELMEQAWFAVTVISSTAVDCAVRRIPVFLCRWLENWPFRYLEQLASFGVGMALNNPQELELIPELLHQFVPCDPDHIGTPIQPESFCELLSRKSDFLVPAPV